MTWPYTLAEPPPPSVTPAVVPPRRRRHPLRWVVLGSLLLLVGWAAMAVSTLLDAKSSLESMKTELDAFDMKTEVRAVLEGSGDGAGLERMQVHAGAARGRLSSGWLVPLRLVPVVNRQLASARALTTTADDFLGAAVTSGAELRALRADENDSKDLAAIVGRASASVTRFKTLLDGADLGPTSDLVPSLASARDRIAAELARVQPVVNQAARALPGLQALTTGRHTLLLAAANNAEMGAGAGLPLAVATLTVDSGRPSIDTFAWSGSLGVPKGVVPLTGDISTLWSWANPENDLRTALVSPSFDQTAPLLAQQYTAATGTSVDGVLMVDVPGLQKMVAALGADTLAGTDLTLDTLVKGLLHDQYIGTSNEQPETGDVRREKMAVLAGVLALRTLDGGVADLDLVEALGTAAGGRHLLAWSSDAAVQEAFVALGASGALGPDSLLPSVQNRSGTKLDYFLQTKASLEVTPAADGNTDVVATFTLTNTVPEGEPRYVAGPFKDGAYGVYAGFFTVNVPGAADQLRLDGTEPLIVQGFDGLTQVIGRKVELAPGASVTVVARWRQPSDIGLVVEPSGRFPGVSWTHSGKTWTDDKAHVVLARSAATS